MWDAVTESQTVARMVQDAFSLTPWVPRTHHDAARLTNVCREALHLGSNIFGVHHAVQTAGVYHFNQAHVREDEEEVTRHGFLRAAFNRLQGLDSDPDKGRLNVRRVQEWISPKNPEFGALMRLAQPPDLDNPAAGGGVRIARPPGFIPNSGVDQSLPRPNPQTVSTQHALRRMIQEGFRDNRLCFILTEEKAREVLPEFHCSPAQWAPKFGKPLGRSCNNCSYRGTGTKVPINGPDKKWLREIATDMFGKIRHPTITDMVAMIVDFLDQARSTGREHERVRLWSMDLQGAYTLLPFCLADLQWMCMNLPANMVVIFLCGIFGWGAMPYAFDVVTRALKWEMNHGTVRQGPLRGPSVMYVDDMFGCTFEQDLKGDLLNAKGKAEGLLGLQSIAQEKTRTDENGTIEVIGYEIRLWSRSVGIAAKNVRKAIYATFSVGNGVNITRREVQRVASHASRYKRICPMLAPFSRSLYAALKGSTSPHTKINLGRRANTAVWMLRALILLTEIDGRIFSRSFESFTNFRTVPEWTVEYDACLDGLGIVWFRETPGTGTEIAMGVWRGDLGRWNLAGKSGFMNALEFLAQTLGLIGLAQRGVQNVAVRVRGDNRAALTWGTERRFRGEASDATAITQVIGCTLAQLDVTEAVHLPHRKVYDYNWRCDQLCRGEKWQDILARDAEDPITGPRLHPQIPEWEIRGGEELLECCRPTRVWEGSRDDFTEIIGKARQWSLPCVP